MTEQAMTWARECWPSLIRLNLEGHVALCALWNESHYVLKELDKRLLLMVDAGGNLQPRQNVLSIIGNLRTPLGLSWFLQGLYHLPQIQHVFVWGSDLSRTGEALCRLWKEGLTSEGTIPELGWTLDDSIIQGRDTLKLFQASIVLHDCRGQSLQEVSEQIITASYNPNRRTLIPPKVFAPTPIPSRQQLPSRHAGIRIDAKDPVDGWLKVINTVMQCGQVRTTRKEEVIAHFFQISVTMPVWPLFQESQIVFADNSPFDFKPMDLNNYVREFFYHDKPEGMNYGYGERSQNWQGRNQVEEVIARLKAAPDTKRATIVFLESSDLETLEDAPCLTHCTYSLIDGILHSTAVYRSHDIYEGWPFNLMALTMLHRYIAHEVNDDIACVDYGTITITSENAQIYQRHFTKATKKIERHLGIASKRPVYDDPAGNFLFDIRDGVVRAMLTNPGGHGILWHAQHQSPETLIRWIVEYFPQLRNDHVLYLGQELEKLRRCIEDKTDYIQG